MTDTLASLMHTVAVKFLGDPNPKLSSAVNLRWGAPGSMSVDLEKGTWFSHEDGGGGGVIDLIRRCDPKANLQEVLVSFGVPAQERRELLALPSNRVLSTMTFDYFDAGGVLAYQVIRRQMSDGGKQFRQQRPGPGGGVVYDMKGVAPLPYNLPKILASSGALFVVEGEKCADAMSAIGLLATTNSGGAKNWRSELNHHLAGRSVVIIPDNDPPGEAHAFHVAQQLLGVAAEIRLLRLPGLKPKGDVADWLEAGGTRKDLIALAQAAPPWSAEAQTPVEPALDTGAPLFDLIPFDDLPEVKIRWLVKDLLPAGGFHNLFGQSGSFKSFVAFYFSAMIATGQEAFGRPTEQGAVVYVASEGKPGLKARRDALVKHYSLPPGTPIWFLPDQIDLRSTGADAERFVETVRRAQIQPVLIVIDTLNRAFSGGNENNSDDMGRFIRLCGWIQGQLECALMIVHHSGKDESKGARGHSSLRAATDAEIEVTKLSAIGDPNRRGSLTVTKQKDGEDGATVTYQLLEIETQPGGIVAGSDRVTSLVVVPTQDPPKAPRRLTKDEQAVLAAVDKALGEAGETVGISVIPIGAKVVRRELAREYFCQSCPLEEKAARSAFDRGMRLLIGANQVGFSRPWIWRSVSL